MLGELSPLEVETMLKANFVGRIGCSDGNRIYVVPISYFYDQNSVLCHSRDGLKIKMMRANPQVCFEVDEIRDYNNWRSVIAWGTYEELTDDNEIAFAKSIFSEELLLMKTTETTLPPHTQRERFRNIMPEYVPSIFYRIRFQELSGRFEKNL